MSSSISCMMIIINLATIIWVLWIVESIPNMVEASSMISSATLEPSGNEAGVHPLEILISTHKLQKGHEDSLALINSLNLPHSCLYSSLTESIIAKCSSSPAVLDGEEKNFFATKLAICELSSANVDYPRDCRGNIQSSKDLNKCIKRLETRPQWWTSWSNCIQSVGVLCQAVREEAERENLLRLHRNLTVLHHQLENRLSSSLNLHTSNLNFTSKTSTMIHSRVSALISEMDALLNQTIVPLDGYLQNIKSAMAHIDRIQVAHAARLAEQNAEFDDQARAQREAMYRIDAIVRQITEAIDTLESRVEVKNKVDERSRRESLEQMSIAIKASTADTIQSIRQTMEALQGITGETGTRLTGLIDSITQGQEAIDTLADGFASLSSSHERISQSMLLQEESAARQLQTVAQQATVFNNTFLNAIAESSGYLQKLSEFQKQSQYGSTVIPGLTLISAYLPVIVSILVVLDRKRSAIAIIFFAAAYTFLVTYPFVRGSEDPPRSGAGEEGLLLDAGGGKYRWLQDCTTIVAGYFRSFW
ncbi:hypothetical protein TWF730_005248 [Orbilia blumenaviensis]|uniref:Nuclear membrane fusion protein Kar5 n=1 Tax=Orbilia blumenaviensis TaxID=1796055 RepID=A0AAV9VK08_9PEZI